MKHPAGRRSFTAAALAIALVSLAAAPAVAQDVAAAETSAYLSGASPEVREALSSPDAADARLALRSLETRGVVNPDQLRTILSKPNFASMARDTLVALDKVQSIPGVDDAVKRMSKAKNPGSLVGPAFEVQVGARFGNRVQAISADVAGHETDILLHDGTLVEVKFLPTDGSRESRSLKKKMIAKAFDQLAIRSEAVRGRNVILVTNTDLSPEHRQTFASRFGATGSLAVARPGKDLRMVSSDASDGKRVSAQRVRALKSASRESYRNDRPRGNRAKNKAKAKTKAARRARR